MLPLLNTVVYKRILIKKMTFCIISVSKRYQKIAFFALTCFDFSDSYVSFKPAKSIYYFKINYVKF